MPNKTIFYKVMSYSVDYKDPQGFEIDWVRQYLVNCTHLVGIVNVAV